MKVLVFSQVPPPVHGSSLMTQRLIDVLRQNGHEVDLLDRRFSSSVSEVGSFSWMKVIAAVGLFARSIRVGFARPDVVIFFATNRLGSFLVDVVVLLVLKAFGVRVLHYVHTVGYSSLASRSRGFRRLVRKFLSVDAVVCLGETVADDLRPFLDTQSKVHIIPNAIPALGEVGTRAVDPPRFVFFANLIEEKGALDFIEVSKKLARDNFDAEFAIYGYPGKGSYMSKLDVALRGSSHATYHGPIGDAVAKAAILESATALLYPSSYPFEAQPLSIIEAMSVGTPVIAYPAGGIAEMVIEGRNGNIVRDVDSMAEAAADLLRYPDRAESLRLTTRGQFEAAHSLAAFEQKWSVLLAAIVK